MHQLKWFIHPIRGAEEYISYVLLAYYITRRR